MSEANDEMPEPTDETSEAEDDARTGEEQAAINRENDPPAGRAGWGNPPSLERPPANRPWRVA